MLPRAYAGVVGPVVLLLLSGLAVGSAVPAPSAPLPRQAVADRSTPVASPMAAVPWGSYMFDVARSGANPNETTITPSNVGALHLLWSATVAGAVEDQPTVAYGHVYVAGWDGYEYAYNVSNGSLDWKTYIGQTQFSNCYASKPRGTTATPTIVNGTIYTLGGDPYFYALNATTGRILWKVSEAVNSPSSGDYNWGSPVVEGNLAYVGLSSACNNPGSQGLILSINLNGTNHTVQKKFAIVPSGQSGGGVWSTGAVDPSANLLWMTTGDEVSASSGDYREVLALNATSLVKVGDWQQPTSGTDFDFGAGPTLFHDAQGRPLVVATNKNGQVYAFNRSNVSTSGWKPIWVDNVSWYDNASPQQACGCALAPAAFDGNALYLAGGYARLQNGTNVAGSVRAVVPSNGTSMWIHASPGIVRAGLTVADGLVYDAADPNDNRSGLLEVLNATDGQRLFDYRVNQTINAPVTVADGQVFFVSANWNNSGVGHLYALGFSLSTQLSRPTGPIPVGSVASFTAGAAGGTAPYRFAWNFGDGSPNQTGASVTHTFARLGNFTSIETTSDAVATTEITTWTSEVIPVPLSIAQFFALPDPTVVNSSVGWTANSLGGYGPLTYLYTGLPQGCVSVNAPSFSCNPTVTGRFPVQLTVHDSVGTTAHAFLNLTVNALPPPGPSVSVFSASPDVLPLGGATWLNVSTSGGLAPLVFAYTDLPPGCLSADTSNLLCHPSTTGTSSPSVRVTDARGLAVTASTTLTVVAPSAVVPQILSFTATPSSIRVNETVVLTLELGPDPSRDSIAYQDLPVPCRSRNTTVLSCTPSTSGTSHVLAVVTDLSGGVASASVNLTVTGAAPPPTTGGSNGAGTPVAVWWAVGIAIVAIAAGVALWTARSRRR